MHVGCCQRRDKVEMSKSPVSTPVSWTAGRLQLPDWPLVARSTHPLFSALAALADRKPLSLVSDAWIAYPGGGLFYRLSHTKCRFQGGSRDLSCMTMSPVVSSGAHCTRLRSGVTRPSGTRRGPGGCLSAGVDHGADDRPQSYKEARRWVSR